MSPCESACEHEAPEVIVDVTRDVIEEVKSTGEDVLEQSQLADILNEIVGEEEAETIIADIIEPIIDTEIINEELPVEDIIEVIEEVAEEENIVIEDELPSTEDVVEVIEEEIIPDHPEVTIVDPVEDRVLTPEEIENSHVTEITNDDGDTVDVIVIEHPEPVPETVVEETEGTGETEVVEEETEVVEEEDEVIETEPATVETVEEESAPVEPEEPHQEEEAAPTPTKPKVEVYETTVETLEPNQTLAEIIESAEGKPLILDFQYDSCPPCQRIAPAFEQLMEDNPEAVFYKVDIMEYRALLGELGVRALPTFKVWVNGELSNTIEGEAIEDLSQAIEDAKANYFETHDESEFEVSLAQIESKKSGLPQHHAALF